ncbi:MAG: DUF1109 domain-containing protein [Caldimonas sp.]
MKTEDLIEALGRGPIAVDPKALARRFGLMVGVGAVATLALLLALLGPRPDLASAIAGPMFWMKLAIPAMLAATALAASIQLARPGGRAGLAWAAGALLLCAVEASAAISVALAPGGERLAMVEGRTAWACITSIVLLSLPILLATVLAMRGLAPTRLRAAGLAAGLVAGTLAATAYALHCDESTLPFFAVWYVLGMAIPGALSALAGPRLLRWA